MKHRLERVNELIRRELGELITRELRFTSKLVTIQQVDITPDLRHAHIYISFIGSEEEQNADMAALHDKRAMLQQALSKRVVLKFTPQLHFKVDASIVRGTRILTIMDQIEHPKAAPDPQDYEFDDREDLDENGR